MRTKHLLLPLLAVVLTMPKKAGAQQDDQSDRRISIEITTTEDGNTTTKRIDLDNASEAEIEEALREMGVMDHFIVEGFFDLRFRSIVQIDALGGSVAILGGGDLDGDPAIALI